MLSAQSATEDYIRAENQARKQAMEQRKKLDLKQARRQTVEESRKLQAANNSNKRLD